MHAETAGTQSGGGGGADALSLGTDLETTTPEPPYPHPHPRLGHGWSPVLKFPFGLILLNNCFEDFFLSNFECIQLLFDVKF